MLTVRVRMAAFAYVDFPEDYQKANVDALPLLRH